MILTGPAIRSAVEAGDIVVDPFEPSRINPNSVDVTLGSEFLTFVDQLIDPAKVSKVVRTAIPPEGIVLTRGKFVLGATTERVGSKKYVPILHGKSGIARAGLFVHVTADLIDIGSVGNLTLQLLASMPIRLYSSMPIAQVSFWRPYGTIDLYKGKYQGSVGPQPSRIYEDRFFRSLTNGD